MASNRKNSAGPGYNALKAEIRQGSCQSLYVLYGEETFLIDKLLEALDELVLAAGSRALDRVVINGDDKASKINLDQLTAEIMTPPFLSRRKLIIVKHSALFSSASRAVDTAGNSEAADDEGDDTPTSASTARSRQEQLISLLSRLPDSVCLVFVETKVDKRLKQLVKVIENQGILAEIGQEQPKTLQQWVEAECRRRKLAIQPAAAENLIDRCELSMQVIRRELDKLFLYCGYTGTTVLTAEMIADLSLPDLRGNIFNLTDALSAGQTQKALQLVDTLISQRQPVQLIQFMLTRHIRQLICAAELGEADKIASELKVMPFVAGRLASQAKRFRLDVLEGLYAKCFASDMLVKTGQLGDRLALETLLIEAAAGLT